MGCIPTKALLHAAEVADTAREGEQFGVKTTFESVDMTGVNRYKDGVVGRLYKGLQGLVSSRQIDYVEGEGRLVAPNTVEVAGRRLVGRHVVLATGSYAKSLPGLEISGRIMTSEQALSLDTVPPRVVVLGGGVIGVEFASVFKSFGSEVTIIEALPRLVAGRGRGHLQAARALLPQAEDRLPHRRPLRRRRAEGRRRDRRRSSPATPSRPTCCWWPSAAGRSPPVSATRRPAWRWTAASSSPTSAAAPTSTACSPSGTSSPACSSPTAASPRASSSPRRSPGSTPRAIDELGIPRVTYCDPEIASVGLTEAQARERYAEVETYDYNLGGNGKSQILQTQGFVKLVREKDGPVVGVHMIGARMGEQVGEAQLIYNWEALPSDVAQLIHAHPTQNEALGEAHLALAGKPLHAHA